MQGNRSWKQVPFRNQFKLNRISCCVYGIVFPAEAHVAQDFLLICVGFVCFLVLSLKIPNIAKKLEDFKKDVEAKKKPPSDKS